MDQLAAHGNDGKREDLRMGKGGVDLHFHTFGRGRVPEAECADDRQVRSDSILRMRPKPMTLWMFSGDSPALWEPRPMMHKETLASAAMASGSCPALAQWKYSLPPGCSGLMENA